MESINKTAMLMAESYNRNFQFRSAKIHEYIPELTVPAPNTLGLFTMRLFDDILNMNISDSSPVLNDAANGNFLSQMFK
jgi:hypothetical protein